MAALSSPLDLLATHLRNSSEIAPEENSIHQRTMAFRRLTEDSSHDSIEDGINTQQTIPFLAVPPPSAPKQQPIQVQSSKAKPVTLAEIRANLARKRSLARKKQLEASRQYSYSLQAAEIDSRPSVSR
jgi:hypothetical protein